MRLLSILRMITIDFVSIVKNYGVYSVGIVEVKRGLSENLDLRTKRFPKKALSTLRQGHLTKF
jgi:hypothetical protein